MVRQIKGTQTDCIEVTHMRLTNSRYCVLWARMDRLEAYLMVSSKEVDSKVLGTAIQSKHFDKKNANGDLYVY